ncbi:MAG TPA: DUF4198 domain-containing protein [Methylophilaceae bacterium]|nr:DUF4198 domain-containing protein [Methylophilaceae bacterium]
MYPTFKRTLLSISLAAAALTAGSAQAHSVWLLPSSTVLSAAQFVTFDAAVSNDIFHFTHRPLALDTLVITAPDGSHPEAVNVSKGELRATFDLKLEKKGTYIFDILRSGLRANWKEDGKTKRFMGTAEAFAKEVPANAQDLQIGESVAHVMTFVTMGAPSSVKPTGVGLEVMSITHPNDLVMGEPAEFQVLVDGKPVADVEVEVVTGQSRYRNALGEIRYKSDKQGKVKVSWSQPGMYYMDAELKDKNVSNKQATERSLSYSVTLEVQPQ